MEGCWEHPLNYLLHLKGFGKWGGGGGGGGLTRDAA